MTYEGTKSYDLTIRSYINCLHKYLDETLDQDTTIETKTITKAVTIKTKTKNNTVKILSRDETVSRDFTSLKILSQ